MVADFTVHDVPIDCINQAAVEYHVPATIILSVLSVEDGTKGLAMTNSNGTIDYGPMQINSMWLDSLKPYGITAFDLQHDPCVNVKVGTWILGQKIASADNLWTGIASYHSKTPHLNRRYRVKVAKAYNRLVEAIMGKSTHE